MNNEMKSKISIFIILVAFNIRGVQFYCLQIKDVVTARPCLTPGAHVRSP